MVMIIIGIFGIVRMYYHYGLEEESTNLENSQMTNIIHHENELCMHNVVTIM